MILNGSANAFASIALATWLVVALVLFWKLRPPLAAALTVLGGRMFLPEAVAFPVPVIPDLDKHSIPLLAALIGCLLTARHWLSSARRRAPAIDRWFVVLLIGHVATYLTNRDPIAGLLESQPGLTLYDLATTMCEDLVLVYLAFVLGRALFRSPRELRTLLLACGGLALIYTPFCLFEMVMSPRLHFEVYGFYQHQIAQSVREGGYRPVVFMSHGIVLARFMLIALLAAALLVRAGLVHKIAIAPALFLGLVFVASRSIGALVLALGFLPVMIFANAKTQVRVAVVVAMIVGLYPLLRGADVFPTETLVGWAEHYNRDRAASLASRFEQEDMLLERARERLLFGWGPYKRSRVYDEQGEDLSVTDGEWIIVLGQRGLTGFVAWYALYLAPIFLAHRQLRRMRLPRQRKLLSGFALISAAIAIDTLPNAAGSLPHFFFSGALCGAVYGLLRRERLARLYVYWQRRRRRARRYPYEHAPVPMPAHVSTAASAALARRDSRAPERA